MTKKLIATIIITGSLLILPGCFGGGEEPAENVDQNYSTYQAQDFSIAGPKEWEIIEPKDFNSRVAENTLLVIRNNIKNELFTANINIITTGISKEQSSLAHAKETIQKERNLVVAFNELQKETINLKNVGNDDETEFVVFEGKYSEEQDTLRYAQVFLAKEDKLYIVTGAYKTTEDEKTIQFIHNSLKSFELK